MSLKTLVYNDHEISIRDDGWFNATEVAKNFGRRLDHWLDTAETLEYIQALDQALTGCDSEILDTRKNGYVSASRARADRGGGTWLHPKLAVAFARWLDAKFGVWCDLKIDEIIKSGRVKKDDAEYLPTYHALHDRIEVLAAASKNTDKVHMNVNKLINKTIGVESGQRHSLPLPRKSLMVVAQATATYAMDNANDHHDGYQMAKSAMQLLKPVADQLAGQPHLKLN
ncbi:MAG: KilA-N domain-containing protein [Comamonas sp.]